MKSGISAILGSPFNPTLRRRPRWKLKRIAAAASDRQMFSVNKKGRCQFHRSSPIIQLLTLLCLLTLVAEDLLRHFIYLITWCGLWIFISKDGKICRNPNVKILLYRDNEWNNVFRTDFFAACGPLSWNATRAICLSTADSRCSFRDSSF